MKNRSLNKILSLAVLLVLCAATVAGAYLGIFGRTVTYADIPTENGVERQPLDRQVAFIPNTINPNWQEVLVPAASLGGGYAYTFSLDVPALNSAADVMRSRAEALVGSAETSVADSKVTVSVPEKALNATLANVLATRGEYDFVLYNAADGTLGTDAVLTAEHVKQAYYYTNGTSYQIQVQFNKKGLEAITELRSANAGSRLYLRMDSQAAAYTTLTAPTNDMLAFTTTDAATAYVVVSCMRSGALPGAATLEEYNAVEATSNAVNVLIIGCAVAALLIAVCLVFFSRLSGLTGVWAIVAWLVVFFLFASLIAAGTGWVMSSLSMTVLVLCFAAFLYGMISLFGAMGAQIKRGRAAGAALKDASRSQIKPLGILYAAVLAIGILMMVIWRVGMYGILGRMVAVSALVSFVMVFVFPRVVLGCFNSLTGKK